VATDEKFESLQISREEESLPVHTIRQTNMRWTQIFIAPDKMTGEIAKGKLESEGISTRITPSAEGMPIGGTYPTGATTDHLLPHFVCVPKSQSAKAKEILQNLKPADSANPMPFPLKGNLGKSKSSIIKTAGIAILVFFILLLIGYVRSVT
jgi:hypothetical protein